MSDDDILNFTIDDEQKYLAASVTREIVHDNVDIEAVTELDEKLANAEFEQRAQIEQTTDFLADQQHNPKGERRDYKRSRLIGKSQLWKTFTLSSV